MPNVVKEKNDSLLLKNLSVKRKGLDINLAGKWLMTDNYSTSQLRGDVNIKKIEAEMDKLGLASIIKELVLKKLNVFKI